MLAPLVHWPELRQCVSLRMCALFGPPQHHNIIHPMSEDNSRAAGTTNNNCMVLFALVAHRWRGMKQRHKRTIGRTWHSMLNSKVLKACNCACITLPTVLTVGYWLHCASLVGPDSETWFAPCGLVCQVLMSCVNCPVLICFNSLKFCMPYCGV